MSDLFVLGDFVMHSGGIGKYKIECDALSDASIDCLAYMIAERVGEFSHVHGIPRGGLRLQKAMEKYTSPCPARLLIVDDVFTTGTSMEQARADMAKHFRHIWGAVIFARGSCANWITPLFRMEKHEAPKIPK